MVILIKPPDMDFSLKNNPGVKSKINLASLEYCDDQTGTDKAWCSVIPTSSVVAPACFNERPDRCSQTVSYRDNGPNYINMQV